MAFRVMPGQFGELEVRAHQRVVLPITSNVSACYPGEVLVTVKGKPGRAMGDQIRSIDKARLHTRIGAVTADELARVDEALAITLALLPTA